MIRKERGHRNKLTFDGSLSISFTTTFIACSHAMHISLFNIPNCNRTASSRSISSPFENDPVAMKYTKDQCIINCLTSLSLNY